MGLGFPSAAAGGLAQKTWAPQGVRVELSVGAHLLVLQSERNTTQARVAHAAAAVRVGVDEGGGVRGGDATGGKDGGRREGQRG